MNRLATLTSVCIVAFAAAAAAQEVWSQRRAVTKSPANEGRMIALGGLYGGQRIGCVQCHGLEGAGDSSGAFPRLTGQVEWYLYKTLQDYASGQRKNNIMGPVARTLSDFQKQQVASHYSSALSTVALSNVDPDVQKRQTGGAIAAAGIPAQGVPACNGCHGRDGRGAAPIYPALAGQFAVYTRHQLLLWKQGKRGGDPLNIMELISKAMTEKQIEAVAAYYAAVAPPPAHQHESGSATASRLSVQQASPRSEEYRQIDVLGLTEQLTVEPPPPGTGIADPRGSIPKREMRK